jgi:hypothetical protein
MHLALGFAQGEGALMTMDALLLKAREIRWELRQLRVPRWKGTEPWRVRQGSQRRLSRSDALLGMLLTFGSYPGRKVVAAVLDSVVPGQLSEEEQYNTESAWY